MSNPALPSVSRSPLLIGALAVGVAIVLTTEALGALRWIARGPVAGIWGAGLLAAGWWWRRGRDSGTCDGEGNVAPLVRDAPATTAVIVLFTAVTLVIGATAAPNSWDGLSYHLPRVERWVAQGHLGYWATPVDRQLFMAPWAGYSVLHLRLLTGGDALAFLPAWLAYLGCIGLTMRIVRELGGDTPQAALGGLLMATAPVAVLQASSVQTDLITAFWVLAAAALALEAWRRPAPATDWRHALALAAATGLAVASKATAALALGPWLILYSAGVVRWGGYRRLLGPLALGIVVGACLNGPAMLRNAALFGQPAGPDWAARVTLLMPVTIGGSLANLIANLAVHVGTPSTDWNAGIARGIVWLAESVLGADAAALFPHYGGFHLTGFSRHESGAGLPVLLGGLGILAVQLITRWPAPRLRHLLPVVMAGTAAILVHAVLVRWQPFGARLQLASFAWLPACIPFLTTRRRSQALLGALAMVLALPALVAGRPRPLVGTQSVLVSSRSAQFARERPEYFAAVERTVLVAGLTGCQDLGILTSYDFPEYFLTALTRREGQSLRWRYIGDVGESTPLGPGPGAEGLCLVLVAEQIVGAEPPGLREVFRVIWVEPPFELLARPAPPEG